MTDPIGVRFISSAVKRDHRELEVLYKGLAQAVEEQDHDAVANLQARFCWELARHLVAVQLFIFPGTEARADAGNTVALRRRGELATVGLRPYEEESLVLADHIWATCIDT